jgi:hypothetical protein
MTMERLFGIASGEQSGLFAETIHKECGRSCDHARLLALSCFDHASKKSEDLHN